MSTVWKKVFANISRPQFFNFYFDSDLSDGYADSEYGLSVARGTQDGYYDVTLPRSWPNAAVRHSWVELKGSPTAYAAKGVVIDEGTSTGVITVMTTNAAGAVANIPDHEIRVTLLLDALQRS